MLGIVAVFSAAAALACAPLGGANTSADEVAPAVSELSPERQATGTAGAATAVYIASLPDFDPNAPTPTPVPPPGADFDSAGAFVDQLLADLSPTTRDYAILEAYMGNPFTIVYLGEEPAGVEPAEAVELLQTGILSNAATLTEVADADLTAILGQPPEEFFGSGEAFVLTAGWGPNGVDEGILIIRERENVFIWDGILLQAGGFDQ